ncbi:MAG: alpha/beta hydrolase [Rhodospirillales bacterium]|nr:alpha/beta hydrolase [Rhodospirillales bacterium]
MSDGAIIHMRRHGNPDGVRLFITHGNGFAVDGLLPFWELLLNDFDLIIFDMRNHGQNTPTGADGHNYAQMSQDLESVFQGVNKELGVKTNIGIFHSMSSRAAMKHATEIGWRWDGLALYDPPNVPLPGHAQYERMGKFERKLVEFSMNRPDRFSDPSELVENYKKGGRSWVEGAHELMAKAVLRQESETGDWVLTCQRELEASIYLAAMTLNLWPNANEFGGPVKLIGADPDMERAPATARTNQALGEEMGYDYEAVPGTGHLLQIEKPVECAAVLRNFLKENKLTA